jgi:hypothetical protein
MKVINELVLNLNRIKNQHQNLKLVNKYFFLFSLINNKYIYLIYNKGEANSFTSSSDENRKRELSSEKVEYDDFFDNEGWFNVYIYIRSAALCLLLLYMLLLFNEIILCFYFFILNYFI